MLGSVVGVAHAEDAVVKAQGQEILLPFKKQLKQALQGGMKQGPDAAIAACNLQAPAIAEALSVNGVEVGRSSHKLRNPGNAPSEWLAPILEAYLDGSAKGPQTLALDDKTSAYVEPISMQPLCLTCHGESLAPEIEARIDSLYPEDQARGFKAGDFRGVFWTTFPKPAAAGGQ